MPNCTVCRTTPSQARDSRSLRASAAPLIQAGRHHLFVRCVFAGRAQPRRRNRCFNYLDFSGISGPNALNGIITSKVIPSYSSNTVEPPTFPTRAQAIISAAEICGLGGTVKTIRPIFAMQTFHPDAEKRRNAIGIQLQASFMTGYWRLVAPPFQRFYMGGENDIRGFDIRSISPVAFLPTVANVSLRNPDGSIVPKDPLNPLLGPTRSRFRWIKSPFPAAMPVWSGT